MELCAGVTAEFSDSTLDRSVNILIGGSKLERARRQFQQASDATTRYVVEQPGKSILLAAAAGAAVAAALLMGSRRR